MKIHFTEDDLAKACNMANVDYSLFLEIKANLPLEDVVLCVHCAKELGAIPNE